MALNMRRAEVKSWERHIREHHGGLDRIEDLNLRYKELKLLHKKSKMKLERGFRDLEKMRTSLNNTLEQETTLKDEIRKLES